MMPKKLLVALVLFSCIASSGCVENRQMPAPITPAPIKSMVPPISATLQADSGIRIHAIQGAGHVSPLVGQMVWDVKGVVTAIRSDGFYLQDQTPDQDVATSEAIVVFTQTAPKVNIGDQVLVSGKVEEFIPGGSATGNLSITQIIQPEIQVLARNQPLPMPIIIGIGGRIPPTEVIEDDRNDIFDPEVDGLDFFESLESMLVQVNNAVVVGPTNTYREIAVLSDNGVGAGLRSARGAIIIRKNDFNPERIILDDLLTNLPELNVGDRIENPILGVLDYSFGTYRILPKQRLNVLSGNLKPELVEAAPVMETAIATFNVQNLDPNDGKKRFSDLARAIVNNLKSPDILLLEEVQDNNGAINNAEVSAEQTYRMLIDEVQIMGGPKYEFIDIAPEPNMDGGEAGGNIRVGFLYRTDRGVTFKPVAGGSASRANEVVNGVGGVGLSFNPGRIDPTNSAFIASRKPLVAEFLINGTKVFFIGVHLNSKGGDTPLYGRYQPQLLSSEIQRLQQAQVIQRFITSLFNLDPQAKLILMGDVNDFQFSRVAETLSQTGMVNLINLLPDEERYTYIYEGNGQVLDQMLVSPALVNNLTIFKPVHINSEFSASQRTSDHDPVYARFKLP